MKNLEIGSLEKWASSVLLIVMVIAATLGVIFRYVLLSPLAWSEELARFSFIWFSYLSASYVFVHGGHIAMNIIQGFFKNRKHVFLLIVDAAQCLITAAFSLFMLRHSYLFLMRNFRAGEITPGLRMPMWIVLLAVPVGFLLMAVLGVQDFYLRNLKKSGAAAEEGGVF